MGGTGSIDWYDDGATTTAAPPPEAAPDPRAFRWPKPAALALSTAAFLLFCAGAWWLTHPPTFVSSNWRTWAPVGFGSLATDVGDLPDTNTASGYTPKVVTFTGISAAVAPQDEPRLAVEFVLCRHDGSTGRVMTWKGSDLDAVCAEVVPLRLGEPVELPTWQVLAVLTPADDLPIRVDGYVLSWRDGARAGRALLGPAVELNSPEATAGPVMSSSGEDATP